MGALNLFAFLDGASPWWWIALAVAIAAAEMLTFTYYLIWIALAALATGLVMMVGPTISGQAQLMWFAGLALGLTIAGHFALRLHRARPGGTPGLNRRAERVIGRTGVALDDFSNDEGVVVVDDVRWHARLAGGAARKGDPLTVIDAEGMRLICEPR